MGRSTNRQSSEPGCGGGGPFCSSAANSASTFFPLAVDLSSLPFFGDLGDAATAHHLTTSRCTGTV